MKKLNNWQNSLYNIIIILKGVNGIFELILGTLIAIISSSTVYKIAIKIFSEELSDDPHDFVANFFVNLARDLSFSTKEFIAAYVFIHGIINILLFYTLWKKKFEFYPTAIITLVLLTVYQIFRVITKHSPLLILITIIDFVIIYFLVREYRLALREKRKQ